MRIRWKRCEAQDIVNTLNIICSEYGMELTNVNVYFSLIKDGILYNLYDFSNCKDVFIDIDKNTIIKKKIEGFACLTLENYEIVQKVTSVIRGWEEDTKLVLLNYLIKEFGILSITQKQNNYKYDEYKSIEDVAYGLMDMCGIVTEKTLEYKIKKISNNMQETNQTEII